MLKCLYFHGMVMLDLEKHTLTPFGKQAFVRESNRAQDTKGPFILVI